MPWELTGNSGTSPVSDFLGTTDMQPLVIKANGAEAMRIASDGNIGIGTTNPITAVPGGRVLHIDNLNGSSTLRLGDGAANGQQWEWQSTVINNMGAMNLSKLTPPLANPPTVLANGNIGIGTTNPITGVPDGRVLHIDNPNGSSTLRLGDGAANGQQWEWQSTVINNMGAMNLSKLTPPLANPLMVLADGNVGIGTINPGQKLTVAGMIESTSGGFRYPDGSVQATATLRGPQGAQGPLGPPGPPAHTSAVCVAPTGGTFPRDASCDCPGGRLITRVLGSSCAATADTGTCNENGFVFQGTQYEAACCVCAPA
jgi:hypothetical protein